MNFVTHTCKKCGCAFVAEDYTNAQDIPPHWRYCPDCAKEKGIDYNAQKSWTNYSEAQKNKIEKLKIIGAEKLKKFNADKKAKT